MTIVELKKDLAGALVSVNQGDLVTPTRVGAWAAALERAERDHPDPESRHYSAAQLRVRAPRATWRA